MRQIVFSIALIAATLSADTTVHFDRGRTRATIPIDLNLDQPFVAATINGQGPYWLVVDTGASSTLILDNDVVAATHLETDQPLTLRGAGGSGSAGKTIRSVTLHLPGVEITTDAALAAPLHVGQASIGHAFDGIVGYGILSQFTVEFDYQHRKLVLDRQPVTHTNGTTFPIAGWFGRMPQIDGAIEVAGQPPIATRVNIDTGAGGVVVPTAFVTEHDLLAHVAKTISIPSRGMGGESKYPVGRLAAITIGPYSVRNPAVALSRDTEGSFARPGIGVNLGGSFLHRFTVTVDYAHGQITLEPNAQYSDAFPFDASGLVLVAEGTDFSQFVVRAIIPASPAAEAGIREGDRISLGGRRFTLDGLRRKLSAAGQTITLRVTSGGATRTLKLKLRALI